jgi:hypothetical protein
MALVLLLTWLGLLAALASRYGVDTRDDCSWNGCR